MICMCIWFVYVMCTFCLVAIANPSRLVSLVINSVGDTWMYVQWEKPSLHSDSHVERCYISWVLVGTGASASKMVPAVKAGSSLDQCFFNITSLTPGSSYHVTVQGVSHRNWGPTSKLVKRTSRNDPMTPSPSNDGDFLDSGVFVAIVTVGSILAVCLVILCLAVVICCYIWCRNRR